MKYYHYRQKDGREFLFKEEVWFAANKWYQYRSNKDEWEYMKCMRPDELKYHGALREINSNQLEFYQAISKWPRMMYHMSTVSYTTHYDEGENNWYTNVVKNRHSK